ncbi:hypothetical protein ADM99_04610 [Leptolinea tardivitalis]|uniref:Uncharacterized protein n=1 Tax=Leptolinea tardivitalis TaxID=229920 RepID=A0A0P6X292_9CHLR|nr:hypothetical protein ADM99_04610 [Leptolinea tardivitalis]
MAFKYGCIVEEKWRFSGGLRKQNIFSILTCTVASCNLNFYNEFMLNKGYSYRQAKIGCQFFNIITFYCSLKVKLLI